MTPVPNSGDAGWSARSIAPWADLTDGTHPATKGSESLSSLDCLSGCRLGHEYGSYSAGACVQLVFRRTFSDRMKVPPQDQQWNLSSRRVHATALVTRRFFSVRLLIFCSHELSLSATFASLHFPLSLFVCLLMFCFSFCRPGRPTRISAGGARAGGASDNQVCGRSREEHGETVARPFYKNLLLRVISSVL